MENHSVTYVVVARGRFELPSSDLADLDFFVLVFAIFVFSYMGTIVLSDAGYKFFELGRITNYFYAQTKKQCKK